MPMTKAQLAAKLRAVDSTYRNRTDDDLVSEYVQTYPDASQNIIDWTPPPPLGGDASAGGVQASGIAKAGAGTADKVSKESGEFFGKSLLESAAPEPYKKWKQAMLQTDIPLPVGPLSVLPKEMLWGLMESQTSKGGLLTLPAGVLGAGGRNAIGALGKASPALLRTIKALDIGGSALLGVEGGANLMQAADPNVAQSGWERVGRAAGGALQVGLSGLGLAYPVGKMEKMKPVVNSEVYRKHAEAQEAARAAQEAESLARSKERLKMLEDLASKKEEQQAIEQRLPNLIKTGPPAAMSPQQVGEVMGNLEKRPIRVPLPKTQPIDPTLDALLGRPGAARAPQPQPPAALPPGPTSRLLELPSPAPEPPRPPAPLMRLPEPPPTRPEDVFIAGAEGTARAGELPPRDPRFLVTPQGTAVPTLGGVDRTKEFANRLAQAGRQPAAQASALLAGPAVQAADPNDEYLSPEVKAAIGALGLGAALGRRNLTQGRTSRLGTKPPVFFSRISAEIAKLPERIKAGAVAKIFSRQQINKDELAFTGMEDFLRSIHPEQQVTRKELEAFMDANQLEVHEFRAGEPVPERLRLAAERARPVRQAAVEAAYEDTTYFTDTMEEQERLRRNFDRAAVRRDMVRDIIKARNLKPQWQNYSYANDADAIPDSYRESWITWKPKAVGPYKDSAKLPSVSSHATSEPNVVVWVRYHDRWDPQTGKKVRFVDEIQSDWGQKGDKAGYIDSPEAATAEAQRRQQLAEIRAQMRAQIRRPVAEGPQAVEELDRLRATEAYLLRQNFDRVMPNMPFKGGTTLAWDAIGMKRVIASAIEDGIDTVQWTTGTQQGTRWPSHIDKIYKNAKGHLVGDVRPPNWLTDADTKVGQVLHPAQIEDLNKHFAIKNWQQRVEAGEVLDARNMAVPGQGFIRAYDERLPSWLNGYANRWGGKVERGVRNNASTKMRFQSADDFEYDFPDSFPGNEPVHSFTIPPAMAETIRAKGQELGFITPRMANALFGATVGGAGGAATGAQTGDTPEEQRRNALMGLVGGAIAGGMGGGLTIRANRPNYNIPRLVSLGKKQIQEKIFAPDPLNRSSWRRMGDAFEEFRADQYVKARTAPKLILDRIGKRMGIKAELAAADDPHQEIYRQMGAGITREMNIVSPFVDMQREVENSGLADRFAAYMNLQGLSYAADTAFPAHIKQANDEYLKALVEELNLKMQGKLGPAYEAGERAKELRKKRNDIINSLDKGELLPEGYNPAKLAQDRLAFQAQTTPEELAQFQKWETTVRQMNQRGLELLGEIIKPGTLKELERRTAVDPRYNPLLRILDTEDRVRSYFTNKRSASVSSLKDVMDFLEGSERTTQHPLAAAFRRFTNIVDRVERNRASKKMFELRSQFGGAPEWDDLIKPVDAKHPVERGWDTLSFYDKGKQVLYQMPADIAKSLKGLEAPDVTKVGGLAGAFFKTLRATGALSKFTAISGNLGFAAANTLRDPGDVMLLAKGVDFINPADQAKFSVELAKAWQDVINNDPSFFDDLLRIGGGNSGISAHMLPSAVTGSLNNRGLLGGALGIIGKVGNAQEMAPKLALARMLKKQGWTDEAIAFEVRNAGSPDFWRRGTMMANMGDWTFLLNGAIQGIERNVRYLKQPEKMVQAAVFAAVVSVMSGKMASLVKDSDGQPSIQRVSTDDLLNYFVVPVPWELTKQPVPRTGQKEPSFLKLPMPFAIRPFMIPIQLATYRALGLRNDDVEQILLSTLSSQLPGQFNLKADNKLESLKQGMIASSTPLIRTVAEQWQNRDASFDIPIETQVDKRYEDPTMRWDAGTSPLARLISQGVFKGVEAARGEGMTLSPKRIAHGMQRLGMRSGVLEPLAKTVDKTVALAAGMPIKPSPEWAEDPVGAARNNPVLGQFARRFVGTGVDQTMRTAIDNFYDLYEDVSNANSSMMQLGKVRPNDAMKLWQDPAVQTKIAIFKQMQKLVPMVSDIHEQRNWILNNTEITNKKELLRGLDLQEQQFLASIAPQLTAWMELITEAKKQPKS